MKKFYPEGILINSEKNKAYLSSLEGLKKAFYGDITLEAVAKRCDSEHNLIIDIPFANAYIKHDDVAIGVKEGKLREIAIISRVGRPISFKIVQIIENNDIPTVILSRVLAQTEAKEQYLNDLQSGDIIGAKVTHLEPFGAFVDIACGIISLIGIENISVSRINHPSDRFTVGQDVFAIISDNSTDKINLTHKELLGTWEENAEKLTINETVTGTIRSIEHYGVFIELFPNLSGLAEYKEGLLIGDTVSVHIKSINIEKMKIKLNIIGKVPSIVPEINYFITKGEMTTFRYSPECCKTKTIIREF